MTSPPWPTRYRHCHPTSIPAPRFRRVRSCGRGTDRRRQPHLRRRPAAGPVSIGRDCLIGNNALLRGPLHIGDGVRIGFASELKNALIGDGVCIGPQCFIADSRIDARAYLGALVRTSNHRLDGATVTVHIGDTVIDSQRDKLGAWIGEGAALGVGVIILPGRIVAPGSQFGPRITVERNLPPGRYRLLQSLHSQPGVTPCD
jgi:bifunctional UDP-N-acetylglucosamine pyrophosphorylase/glucosamine-1-phosphate N-acetyltransferase